MSLEDTDPLADPSDQATRFELSFTADALTEAHRTLAPESHPDFDGAHCLDCANEIPKARLANGRIRCTSCQEILDSRKKRGLKH